MVKMPFKPPHTNCDQFSIPKYVYLSKLPGNCVVAILLTRAGERMILQFTALSTVFCHFGPVCERVMMQLDNVLTEMHDLWIINLGHQLPC